MVALISLPVRLSFQCDGCLSHVPFELFVVCGGELGCFHCEFGKEVANIIASGYKALALLSLTGIKLRRYKREAKKARAYGTRTDATRYARGKSANFVPTREIFFVRYNTEKNTRARIHADER